MGTYFYVSRLCSIDVARIEAKHLSSHSLVEALGLSSWNVAAIDAVSDELALIDFWLWVKALKVLLLGRLRNHFRIVVEALGSVPSHTIVLNSFQSLLLLASVVLLSILDDAWINGSFSLYQLI